MEKVNIGSNTKAYLVTGHSGVGKTTICNQLKDQTFVLCWDKIKSWPLRQEALIQATFQQKPILVEVPLGVRRTLTDFDWLTWDKFMVMESEEVIIARRRFRVNLPDRKYNEKCLRCRIRALERYSEEFGNFFVGNSDQCLKELSLRFSVKYERVKLPEVELKIPRKRTVSEETRRKISQSRLGIQFNEDTINRMSAAHKGIKRKRVTRKKISEYQTGRKKSPEHVAAIREAMILKWKERREKQLEVI
jgi:hypothetical protein